MAIYKNIQSGNFSSSSTWGTLVNYVATGPSLIGISTSIVASNTVTSLSNTINGIMTHLGYRVASPTGTITCQLYNSSTSSVIQSVTINASDLPADSAVGTVNGGWVHFKFSASTTLNAAQAYSVRMSGSVTNQAYFYNASSTDWNRAFVCTTGNTPTIGDSIHVGGDYSSAGVYSAYTVTIDNTSATLMLGPDSSGIYGVSPGSNSITISSLGTLAYGTSSSTKYFLGTQGNITVYCAGTLQMGSSGTTIPSSSTASLLISGSTAGQYGLCVAGNLITYGASKTVKAKLAADISLGATSGTTDVVTGWLSGDTIAIAGTTRTVADGETTFLSGDSVGTTVKFSGATLAAHGGNASTLIQADIVNLTRNVNIYGTSPTIVSYITTPGQSPTGINNPNISTYYTGFYNLGTASAVKPIIAISNPTANADVRYCSFYGTSVANAYGFFIYAANNSTINFNYNVCYNVPTLVSTGYGTVYNSTTLDNNVGIKTTVAMNSPNITFTNNTIANGTGIGITIGSQTGTVGYGTINNLLAYGNSSYGVSLSTSFGTASNITAWRNNAGGLYLTAVMGIENQLMNINGGTLFGNGYGVQSAGLNNTVFIQNFNTYGGSTLVQSSGFFQQGGGSDYIVFYNSTFGPSHSASDIYFASGPFGNMSFINCTFSSTTKITTSNLTRSPSGLGVSSINENGVAGSMFAYSQYGTSRLDTTIYNSSSPSLRQTPTTANVKFGHTSVKINVTSGGSATVSVKVRKSVVGDGTAYNGNAPRLMLRPNFQAGITSFSALTTSVSAAGTWETLTATLPTPTVNTVYELYVDCDGTTGWINIDDWSTTYYAASTNLSYWKDAQPYVALVAPRAQVSSFFAG